VREFQDATLAGWDDLLEGSPGIGQFLAYDTGSFVPGALWYCTKGPWLLWDDEEAVRAFSWRARGSEA
jgi:hypothetical protein